MRGWLRRGYWWWMRRTSVFERFGTLDFIYVSAELARKPEDIAAALSTALSYVRNAGAGFGELVEQLRFVASGDAGRTWVLVPERGYVSNFPAKEVNNPFLLACNLIWAATWVRMANDALRAGDHWDEQRVRRAAQESRLRFARLFPNGEEWIEYFTS